jgi:hypothetical protein
VVWCIRKPRACTSKKRCRHISPKPEGGGTIKSVDTLVWDRDIGGLVDKDGLESVIRAKQRKVAKVVSLAANDAGHLYSIEITQRRVSVVGWRCRNDSLVELTVSDGGMVVVETGVKDTRNPHRTEAKTKAGYMLSIV